nr:PREDICTED: oocyte zinc finger protein XlCOF28-like isoform X1 [Bemisia tabaci]
MVVESKFFAFFYPSNFLPASVRPFELSLRILLTQFGYKTVTATEKMDPDIEIIDLEEEGELDTAMHTSNTACSIQATCYYCGSIFTMESAFMNHMEFFHRLGPCVKCHLCYEVCPKNRLESHIKCAHQTSQPVSTAIQLSVNQTKAPSHQWPSSSYDTPVQQFSCTLCGAKFPFQQNLDDHMSVHVYEKKFSIATDASRNNSLDEKNHKCDVCFKTFYVKEAMDRHKKKKHILLRKEKVLSQGKRGRQFYKCDTCQKSFPALKNLRIHISWHLKNEKSKLASPNSEINQKKNRVIQSSEQEEFWCKLCSRLFKSRRGLMMHEYWHNGHYDNRRIKGFTKSACKKPPKQRNKRRRKKNRFFHVKKSKGKQIHKVQSLQSGDKTMEKTEVASSGTSAECPPKDTVRRTTTPSKHKLQLSSCSYCDEKFMFYFNYRLHMETHPIKKNLVCLMCTKRFAFKATLEHHELIEHGDANKQLVNCSLCEKPFLTQKLRDIHYQHCYKVYLLKTSKEKSAPHVNDSSPIDESCTLKEQSGESPPPNVELFRHVIVKTVEASLPPLLMQDKEQYNADSTSTINNHAPPEPLLFVTKPSPSYQPPSRHYFWCNICSKMYRRENLLLYHLLIEHPSEKYPVSWEPITLPLPWHNHSPLNERTLAPASDPPLISSSPDENSDEENTERSINSLDLSTLNDSSSSCTPQNEILRAYSNFFFP